MILGRDRLRHCDPGGGIGQALEQRPILAVKPGCSISKARKPACGSPELVAGALSPLWCGRLAVYDGATDFKDDPVHHFRGLEPLPQDQRGAAVALGNFDGVHFGHRAILQAARDAGGMLGVVTFEPHPRSILGKPAQSFRLTSAAGKARALADVGLIDEKAADDIRDLRSLLGAVRIARHTAWQTVVRLATTGLILALIAGVAIKLKFGGQ